MKRVLLLTLLVLLTSGKSGALTWNFDTPGDAQGGVAVEGVVGVGTLTLLSSEVRDGIWRVIPHPFEKRVNPGIDFLSPLINYDSALFDRLAIRFRLVHTQPVAGTVGLSWTNPTNVQDPDSDPSPVCDGPNCYSRFAIFTPLLYTTEWQEVVLSDLRSRQVSWGDDKYEILWEGALVDIRISMGLWEFSFERPWIEVRTKSRRQ